MRHFISPLGRQQVGVSFGGNRLAAALHIENERLLRMFLDVIGQRVRGCRFRAVQSSDDVARLQTGGSRRRFRFDFVDDGISAGRMRS